MSLGRTGRTNHAKGGRPPKRRTVVIHGGLSLKLFYLIFLLELEIWLYNKKAP